MRGEQAVSAKPFDAPIDASLFMGRAEAVKTVTGRLNDANFSSTSVVGGPKTGKTSLLQYVASDAAKKHLVGADRMLRVYLDVEALGGGMTPYDFWTSVLRQLRPKENQFPLLNAAIASATAHTLTMFQLEDLFAAFYEKGFRVVLLVDNWDTVLRNASFWPPVSNFLHLVRYFGQGAQQRTVAWVLSTQRPLLDLWDSNRGASPYYNIFETVMVGSLTDAEVRQFTKKAFERAKLELDPELDEFIDKASCGHPYLLNFLVTNCLNHDATAGEPDPGELLAELSKENGPLVSLIQQIRGSMSAVERQLFDKSVAVPPQVLTSNQAKQLATLASYGLLPPRPKA